MGSVHDLEQPEVEELLLDWLYSFLTRDKQDRLTGWHLGVESRMSHWSAFEPPDQNPKKELSRLLSRSVIPDERIHGVRMPTNPLPWNLIKYPTRCS